MPSSDQVTAAYRRYGLPATMPAEQRQAWADHLAGKPVPMRLLPTNGAQCHADSMGGPHCGYPLLVDGSCPNRNEHRDVVEADLAAFAAEHENVDEIWDAHGGRVLYRSCMCGHRWDTDIPYCPEGPEPDEDDRS